MGADELDIDSDWKKARAFLIAYSTVVLLAWYFSADLNTISMMGVSIQIKANAHNVWLVIAAINLYFMIRYVQKLPNEYRTPDDKTLISYEDEIIKNTYNNNRKNIVNQIIANQDEDTPEDKKIKRIVEISPDGKLLYRLQFDLDRDSKQSANLVQYRKYYRNKVNFAIPYSFESNSGDIITTSGINLELTPSTAVVYKSHFIGYLKGALFTPWFTDSIIPLLFGYSAYGVSLISWLTVNKYI